MTGSLDKRIAEEIAARRDDLVALTRDLIRIPTLNPPGHNYREICDYLAARLSRSGFTVTLVRAQGALGDSDAHPRWNLVARHDGTGPGDCVHFNSHHDVVEVGHGWTRDPFGGELVDGEVWGRGAVDMLNLTSSMAVAFRHLVASGRRFPGDLVYFAVADEEAGGRHGAQPLVADEWDALRCDYVLTEFGGMPLHSPAGTTILITTAEKGIGWSKITVKGTPGH
ncbi:MAG: M20/M25/M40 family metallo-hydrolase, partial [Rhodobacteraceae bacterium]|nr:M20/M25/M40 family metallo-hydrolase [Paracoccaceae bacterium]